MPEAGAAATGTDRPECFVIMPVSDRSDYPAGHFSEVYEGLLAPACEAAGFRPTLASRVVETHLIHADILRRLRDADMVPCDLSAQNANVYLELGFRQAFDLPVVLVMDTKTPRVFDVQGLSTIPYEADLRPSQVRSARAQVEECLKSTLAASTSGDRKVINSLVRLLDLAPGAAASAAAARGAGGDSALLEVILSELHTLRSTIESPAGRLWDDLTKRSLRPGSLGALALGLPMSPRGPSDSLWTVNRGEALYRGMLCALAEEETRGKEGGDPPPPPRGKGSGKSEAS